MDPQFQHLADVPHFKNNMNFHSESKTVIFAYFLMPTTMSNFRKI